MTISFSSQRYEGIGKEGILDSLGSRTRRASISAKHHYFNVYLRGFPHSNYLRKAPRTPDVQRRYMAQANNLRLLLRKARWQAVPVSLILVFAVLFGIRYNLILDRTLARWGSLAGGTGRSDLLPCRSGVSRTALDLFLVLLFLPRWNTNYVRLRSCCSLVSLPDSGYVLDGRIWLVTCEESR